MAVDISLAIFSADDQGRRFSDVVDDPDAPLNEVLSLLAQPAVQQRLEDAEIHHDRPALAGIVRELEHLPTVDRFFQNHDGNYTRRFRQAVGVAIRIVMEGRGWRKTGRKGSLGQRVRVAPRTTTPGAYHNNTGIARWFTRAERYTRPGLPA